MTKDRHIECEFDLEAPIEKVWQAITEAKHIQNWFAPHAESVSGEGGYIDIAWTGPDQPMRLEILAWELEKYLKTTWHAAPKGEQERLLPLEIFLEKTATGTRLRLVHSGFLSEASWDDEFESHNRGWNTELRQLRYYLENQYGRSRDYFLKRLPVDDKLARISFFLDDSFFGGDRTVQTISESSRDFALSIAKELWQCQLLYQFGDKDFVFLCDALEGGIIRLSIEMMTGSPELWFWVTSYSLNEQQMAKRTAPLLDHIKTVLH